MHRVLAIPELLDTVFKAMDNRSNLNNALVSRAWSEIALDTLWRHVDDLYRLFSLLGPLKESDSGRYVSFCYSVFPYGKLISYSRDSCGSPSPVTGRISTAIQNASESSFTTNANPNIN
jgi:hypothetical protein